jgi:hypothetical protein
MDVQQRAYFGAEYCRQRATVDAIIARKINDFAIFGFLATDQKTNPLNDATH